MDKKRIPAAAGQAIRGALRRGGERWKEKDPAALRQMIVPAGIFFAGLLLGGARITAGVYPFGIALLCAVPGFAGAACAYGGTVLATLGMQTGALLQIVVLTALFLVRLGVGIFSAKAGKDASAQPVRREVLWRQLFQEGRGLRISQAAAAAAAIGCVGIFNGASTYYDIVAALLWISFCPLFCGAFLLAGDRTGTKELKLLGMCGVLFALTLALDAVPIPFSPGILFSYFITIWATYAGGVSYGIVWGLFCGMALEPAYAPMYPIAALTAGLLFKITPGGSVFAAAVTSICWALQAGGFSAITDVVPELALASALLAPLLTFRLLPAKLPAHFTETGNEADVVVHTNKPQRRYVRICRSLESLSRLLFSVSDKLRCPTSQDSYRICTAVRARYCCGCVHEGICCKEEETEVNSFFDNMAHRLSTHGKVSARLVPEELARRCHHMDGILDAVNTSAGRVAGMSAASEKTELFASDYAVIAQMLRETEEAEDEWKGDPEGEQLLSRALRRQGFSYTGASVYGSRLRRVYMRGVDLAGGAGAEDIRQCAESVLGGRLSAPEFSLDGAYVSASMHSVPMYTVKNGRFSTAGVRDDTSGDSVCSFENGEGYAYTLVSDGMGSGRDAALTSGISSVFLEKLLTAGCPMKSALEMLNCFVRGSDGECFTTVDLMEADLMTGRARFIKSGAAPSFVIRGGQLFRLHSKTVPVGIIRALDAEAISFDLQDGDTVIMMTDGVTGNYEDCPWLYDLLCSGLMNTDSPAAAARMIGERAAQVTGREDDITVCVMKIMKT